MTNDNLISLSLSYKIPRDMKLIKESAAFSRKFMHNIFQHCIDLLRCLANILYYYKILYICNIYICH